MGIRRLRVIVLLTAVVGCGGNQKQPDKPATTEVVKPPPPPETEADREVKRHAAAIAIVPDGATCLPVSLRDQGAPRLDVASIDGEAMLCAVDTDRSRLLGTIGCWKVTLPEKAASSQVGGLTYQPPLPLPGHDIAVKLNDGCARGYCLPKDAAAPPADGIVHLSWNRSSKVALLAGDEVHLYDAATKQHTDKFSIRGDKGAVGPGLGVEYVGDYILVEAGEPPNTGVWVFKDDQPKGPITAIGAKDATPISTTKGGLLLLGDDTIGVSELGFTSVTTYELATGKRTKLVRRVNRPDCKPDELTEYWKDGDKVTDRCRDSMAKSYEHLIGASAVAGAQSWLVVLRGPRLGELGVLDPRTLAEKRAIKLPWCEAAGSGAPPAAASAP